MLYQYVTCFLIHLYQSLSCCFIFCICLESYMYQCMEACFVQYVDYQFFSFFFNLQETYQPMVQWYRASSWCGGGENILSSPRLLSVSCKSLSTPCCLFACFSGGVHWEKLADKGGSFPLFYVQGLGLSCSDTDGCGSPRSELQQWLSWR